MRAQRPGDILVVDSDEQFLATVTAGLRALDHHVEIATTAHEARRHLEKLIFDVVICAHRLPDQRGEQLCHFIKSDSDLGQSFVALTIDLAAGGSEAEDFVARYYAPHPRIYDPTEPDDIILKPVAAAMLAGRVMNLLRMRRYLQESSNAIGALMAAAQGVEEQDVRKRGHCKRLAMMSIELGSVMGCDEWELTALERAGYLHDIGMVTINGALTHKSGNLSPAEMEVIKSHTVRGETLCKPVAALGPVLPIIRSHHERADGTGYPDGLRGENIPKLAQIFAIPHLYEALRSWRPYQSAGSEARAVMVMREEVNWGCWNARVFDAFVTHVLPGLEERLDMLHINWPITSSRHLDVE